MLVIDEMVIVQRKLDSSCLRVWCSENATKESRFTDCSHSSRIAGVTMLQPLPNIFLAYFHFQQNNQKLEQAGVSHIIKLSYNKPAVSASDDFNKIYLEKHNLHGQTLDVLVVKLENEIMKNKVFTVFS